MTDPADLLANYDAAIPHRPLYKPRLERPSWWKPEEVLTLLQKGQRVVDVAMRASQEMGGAPVVNVFRKEISIWANSASWGEQFQKAMKLARTHTRTGETILSKDWYEDFYDELRAQVGVIPLACDAQGIDVDLVYALRDRRNKCYDEVFDEQVRIIENLRLSKLRENLLQQARVEDVEGAKLASKVLESHMPSLHGQKAHLEISGGLHNTTTHYLLPAEVVAASQARTRTLLANRERHALPAGHHHDDVVDVTPVAAKAKRG